MHKSHVLLLLAGSLIGGTIFGANAFTKTETVTVQSEPEIRRIFVPDTKVITETKEVQGKLPQSCIDALEAMPKLIDTQSELSKNRADIQRILSDIQMNINEKNPVKNVEVKNNYSRIVNSDADTWNSMGTQAYKITGLLETCKEER